MMSDEMNNEGYRRPDARGVLERSPRWVRVKLGETTIAESKEPWLLLQYGRGALPTYFFHRDEVNWDYLAPGVDKNGRRRWSVRANGHAAANAAWAPADLAPHLAELTDHITFNWRDVAWFEEDEQVYVHARDPHKRIDALQSTRHVQVSVDGVVVADSRRPVVLFETWLPTRYYIPREDVRLDLLRPTSLSTQCPYKGVAEYWSLHVGDRVLDNVVWSYPDPIRENPKIKGLLCFFNEKVDIRVDGEQEARPQSPWSD